MKKIITMLLVGLMVLGSFSVTFAEEPTVTNMENFIEEVQMSKKFNLMKEFTAETHKINALRVERNQLQIQVIERQDKLFELYLTAKESGNKEALKAAKEKREQIIGINKVIKELHQQVKATRKAFREALKNNDKESSKVEIENLINIHTSINAKIKEKIVVLDSIQDILS